MTDARQNYTQFKDPEEIALIFKNLDELYKLYGDKKVIQLSNEDIKILNLVTGMITQKKKYQSRMDKEYWKWEKTRERSESEIQSERYNHPG